MSTSDKEILRDSVRICVCTIIKCSVVARVWRVRVAFEGMYCVAVCCSVLLCVAACVCVWISRVELMV